MKVTGILGVGELTEKLIRGLLRADPDVNILLSPRNAERARGLSETLPCKVMQNNQEVVDQADIIILGVRPGALDVLAREVIFRPEQTVISLAAGISLERLQQIFNHAGIVRMMLTYAAEINKTTVVMTQCDQRLSKRFAGLGELIITADEHAFELATVGMCMNGWFYSFAGQLQHWLTDKGMASQDARRLVLGAMRDCAAYATHSPDCSLEDLASSIATPGTYTAQGKEILDAMDSFSPWRQASDAIFSSLYAGSGPDKTRLK